MFPFRDCHLNKGKDKYSLCTEANLCVTLKAATFFSKINDPSPTS
jgi:hypothetical protein